MRKHLYTVLGIAALHAGAYGQIQDFPVVALDSQLCEAGPGHIRITDTEIGVGYTLRNSSNVVILGPVAGTGTDVTFNIAVNGTETYNVLAEAVHSTGILFDGVDDYVVAPIDSTFNYQNAFTYEAWVKTPDPSTGYYEPVFYIGTPGFSDLEVYVRPNDLIVLYERGKPGLNSRTYPSPPDDVWFHLAVVYDGAGTTVFYDGVQQNVTSGSGGGVLTKTAGATMSFGVAPNITVTQSHQKYMEGQLDDIRIWNTARMGADITNNMSTCFTGSESGFEAYYPVNGIPGNSNMADGAGTNHGQLTNMNPMASWVIVETALAPCVTASPIVLTQTPTITLTQIDISLTQNGQTLSANQGGATYQWINCNTFSAIPGETGQSFTATASGDYAVIISMGGCADTSSCQNITVVGFDAGALPGFVVYPNPTLEGVTVVMNGHSGYAAIVVMDLLGKVVSRTLAHDGMGVVALPAERGVYLVQVEVGGLSRVHRVVKE